MLLSNWRRNESRARSLLLFILRSCQSSGRNRFTDPTFAFVVALTENRSLICYWNLFRPYRFWWSGSGDWFKLWDHFLRTPVVPCAYIDKFPFWNLWIDLFVIWVFFEVLISSLNLFFRSKWAVSFFHLICFIIENRLHFGNLVVWSVENEVSWLHRPTRMLFERIQRLNNRIYFFLPCSRFGTDKPPGLCSNCVEWRLMVSFEYWTRLSLLFETDLANRAFVEIGSTLQFWVTLEYR